MLLCSFFAKLKNKKKRDREVRVKIRKTQIREEKEC